MKTDYQIRQERARQRAIAIQTWLSEHAASYGELAEIQDELERLGKNYGLLTEFRENGLL